MKYTHKLTKISKHGPDFNIKVGDSFEGWPDKSTLQVGGSFLIQSVEGWRVTSIIKKLERLNPTENTIVIHTLNSVYHLEQL